MIDPNKMRLAADPHRTMTDAERDFFSQHMPKADLPPAITVPTRSGGKLTITLDGDFADLKAGLPNNKEFAMRCLKTDLRFFMKGSCQSLPGVGRLVASPIGRDRVRLVLLPEREGSNDFRGGSFEADLRFSEVMARL